MSARENFPYLIKPPASPAGRHLRAAYGPVLGASGRQSLCDRVELGALNRAATRVFG